MTANSNVVREKPGNEVVQMDEANSTSVENLPVISSFLVKNCKLLGPVVQS